MVLDFLGAGIVSLSALRGILYTLATVLHILEKRKLNSLIELRDYQLDLLDRLCDA